MPVDLCWTLYHPVIDMFFIKAAGIADPSRFTIITLHFVPGIFSCGYTQHLVAPVPEDHFTTAGRAITMRIYRPGEPYPVLEAECSVGQGPNRAYIDHISTEIIIDRFRNIGGYLRMIAAVKDPVHTLVG